MDYTYLVEKAFEAQKTSLPTYSNFHVGAALETSEGKIILGGNIESPSYSLTICAERTAIFKAISEGERNFKAIAVVGETEDFCAPCGACRQIISDLCGDIDVIMVNGLREMKVVKISELLPYAFAAKDLK